MCAVWCFLQERKSQYFQGFSAHLRLFDRQIFKSFTCDNGCEFTNTEGMEYSPSGKQRTTIYYCHPYCSSERGSNENQNGFIRRFIPKGTPISKYTPQEIKEIQNFINHYPRGIFNYQNSATLFENELQNLGIEKNQYFFKLALDICEISIKYIF